MLFRRFSLMLVLSLMALGLALPAVAQQYSTYTIGNASRVNLRSGPGAEYAIITVLSAGTQVVPISYSSDYRWAYIQVVGSNALGWVNANYVVAGGYVPPAPPPQTPPTYGNAVVNTGRLNVRQGPAANFGVAGKLTYNDAITLVARNADASWAQISAPINGWVSLRYINTSVSIWSLPIVSDTGVNPGYPEPVPPQGGQTGIVVAPTLNVRYGPGVYFSRFTTLNYGTGVSLVGRSADASWLLVQLANGQSGWVNTGFISTTYAVANLPVRA
jgi:uncharacterized protein YraI